MYGKKGRKKAGGSGGRQGRGLGLNHLLPYGMKTELRTCLVLWKQENANSGKVCQLPKKTE